MVRKRPIRRGRLRRTAKECSRLGILLLIAACGSGFDADDYTPEVAAARFEKLRPALERVLCEPYGASPTFRAATRDDRIAAITSAIRERRVEIWSGHRDKDLADLAVQIGTARATLRPVTLDLATGDILLEPEAFNALAELVDEPELLLGPGFLDMAILHEAVLLFDHRRVDLRKFVGSPLAEDALLCREAVAHGHAEFVVRRVVEEVSLRDEHQLARLLCSQPPKTWLGEDADSFRGKAALKLSHALMQGEAFMDALAVKIGYPAARDMAFNHPPGNLDSLSYIELYRQQPYRRRLADLPPEKFAGIFDRERYELTRRPLDQAILAQACAVAEKALLNEGIQGVRDALAVTAVDRESAGRIMVAVVVECETEDGAEAFLTLNRSVLIEKERRLNAASSGTTVLSSSYTDSGVEDLPGTFAKWDLRRNGETEVHKFRTLLVRSGSVVLEITSDGGVEELEGLVSIARQVLAAVLR